MAISPMALDSLDLARWQFGITTVYHFFMVPADPGSGLVVTYLYICTFVPRRTNTSA